MIGKFGQYYKQVNMAWMWARIKARTTRLGTFEGGFQAFADLFAQILREMGVDIRLGAQLGSIKPRAGRVVAAERDRGSEVLRPGSGHHLPAICWPGWSRICPKAI